MLWFVFVAEKAVVVDVVDVPGDAATAALAAVPDAGLFRKEAEEVEDGGEGTSAAAAAFKAAVALCSTSASLLFSATLTANGVSFGRFFHFLAADVSCVPFFPPRLAHIEYPLGLELGFSFSLHKCSEYKKFANNRAISSSFSSAFRPDCCPAHLCSGGSK